MSLREWQEVQALLRLVSLSSSALLAAGMTQDEVLAELPDLEDIAACLRLASRRLNHPIVAA